MKTELITKNIEVFKESFFFIILLGFSPYWEFKFNQKLFNECFSNINLLDKIHLKCICINWSILLGAEEPILFSFILNKHP